MSVPKHVLGATSHTSQGPWPCDCEGLWLSSEGCASDTVCQNLRHAYLPGLLEVGALQIVAHHETLSILSMSRKNPCTSFIHGNFFGPSGLHLLAWSEHRRSQSSRPMREVLEMQLERALSPDRLEELPLSPGYFFPRENVNPCHFQPSSYIFPCMTPPQAIIMHLCMLQCNIL